VTHFGAYWKWFDSAAEPRCVSDWRVRLHSRLADAGKGDILWLFTSGAKCKKKLPRAELPCDGVKESLAYLTEVFTIHEVIWDEIEDFKWRVVANEAKCVEITPPILIDRIVRPGGWDEETKIGALRQGA